jgi:hypothetical protein
MLLKLFLDSRVAGRKGGGLVASQNVDMAGQCTPGARAGGGRRHGAAQIARR